MGSRVESFNIAKISRDKTHTKLNIQKPISRPTWRISQNSVNPLDPYKAK